MSDRTLQSSDYWSAEDFAESLAHAAFLLKKVRSGKKVDDTELCAALRAGREVVFKIVRALRSPIESGGTVSTPSTQVPSDLAQGLARLVQEGRRSHAYLAEDVARLQERLDLGVDALRDEDIDLMGTLAEQANLGAARAYRRLRRR
jgi:hypothetical protein